MRLLGARALVFLLRELEIVRRVVRVWIEMERFVERLDRVRVLFVVEQHHALIEKLLRLDELLLFRFTLTTQLRQLCRYSENVRRFRSEFLKLLELLRGIGDIAVVKQVVRLIPQRPLLHHPRLGRCVNGGYR